MAKPKLKFPNIYRSFTDPLRQSFSEARRLKIFSKNSKLLKQFRLQSILTVYVLTVALILLLSIDILVSLQRQKEISFERQEVQSEIKVLQQISEKYPNSKEVYFELANLEYKLKNFNLAKYYVNKAILLDPNFQKAEDLYKKLRGY